jgi:hypothetical protein
MSNPQQQIEIKRLRLQIETLQKQLRQLEQNPQIARLNESLKKCFLNVILSAQKFMNAYNSINVQQQPRFHTDLLVIIKKLSTMTTVDIYNDIVYRIVSVDFKLKNPRPSQIYTIQEIQRYISKKTLLESIDNLSRLLEKTTLVVPSLVAARTELIRAFQQLKICVSNIPW